MYIDIYNKEKKLVDTMFYDIRMILKKYNTKEYWFCPTQYRNEIDFSTKSFKLFNVSISSHPSGCFNEALYVALFLKYKILKPYEKGKDSYCILEEKISSVQEIIKKLKSRSYETYNNSLENFVSRYGFREIYDLNEVENEVGNYIIALNNYRYCYMGVEYSLSYGIKKHILKKLGELDNGWVKISAFGPRDISRIFVKSYDENFCKKSFYR